MHPPSFFKLPEDEKAAVAKLAAEDEAFKGELEILKIGGSPGEILHSLAQLATPTVAESMITGISPDAQRMFEEHRAFNVTLDTLRSQVASVLVVDPFEPVPPLGGSDLILLDYFLDGGSGEGARAEGIARDIVKMDGRAPQQQLVLMSSHKRVRDFRAEFRERAGIEGSTFAFISKSDLNAPWKIKAHLEMLVRARPYGSVLANYRTELERSLQQAQADLLALVDDLDIGDYAFLQNEALMSDGHPLGDYMFSLLSTQYTSLAFETKEMRALQSGMDELEFVGQPFASTEPSTVVANLFHNAILARDLGPLGPHPRAKQGSGFETFPFVQLGDVFFNAARNRAVVVLSAACDLAFSPTKERKPDPETPIILVPGRALKLDAKKEEDVSAKTEGILVRNDVFRIDWIFSHYRSAPLSKLSEWLEENSYETSNRDRLRPLYSLKLQQEFGAHLLRVGPPIMPPFIKKVTGRLFICNPKRKEVLALDGNELAIARFKGNAKLKLIPSVVSEIRNAAVDLEGQLEDQVRAVREAAEAMDEGPPKEKKFKDASDLQRKVDSLRSSLDDDEYWIGLLAGVELASVDALKPAGAACAFVLGADWKEGSKPTVVLQVVERPDDAAAPVET
ncbi:hypothetical protein [Methylobacterium sp. Leaf88]|uniref:hypothetical protein n=1 Tax=Methylobacterium sp. Leaf88 TaxID=1736244 RepID=UPI0012E84C90|nr:hypothetical protein [Methylobacterium sp. Leaf88]